MSYDLNKYKEPEEEQEKHDFMSRNVSVFRLLKMLFFVLVVIPLVVLGWVRFMNKSGNITVNNNVDTGEWKCDRRISEKACDLLNEGLEEKRKTKYEEAAQLFTQAIERTPYFPDAYKLRAESYYSLGREEEAVQDYLMSVEMEPDAKIYKWLGNYFYNKGDYGEAAWGYSGAIEMDYNDYDAFFSRGCALFEMQLYHDAISDFDRVLALNSTHDGAVEWRRAAEEWIAYYERKRR